MSKLHIDFETFSEIDLNEVGVYKYAEHESTSLNVVGWAFDDGPVNQWLPFEWSTELQAVTDAVWKVKPDTIFHYGTKAPKELADHINSNGEVRAHNAQFERVVGNGVAGDKVNFPAVAIKQTTCTAVKAAASGIPRALGNAAEALGTYKKSDAGRIEMLQLAKPRKPTKDDPSTRWTIYNAPEKWVAMLLYNIDDVVSERDLDDALPDITPREQLYYFLDQKINEVGWAADLEAVRNILFVVEQYKVVLAAECEEITKHWVEDKKLGWLGEGHWEGYKPSQREKISDWIRANGFSGLQDMTADTVKKVLKRTDVPEVVKRLLKIYSAYGAKSVSKLQAILDSVCKDGRLRGMFIFKGAGPGRWSSVIVQLQNIMRPVIKDPNTAIEAFAERDIDYIRFLYPDVDPMKVAGSCVRGCLVSRENCDLVFPDYSGIEDRVNAWLFDEDWVLQAYRDYDSIIPGKFDKKGDPLRVGRHLYSLTVCNAFGLDIDQFDDEDPRRQQGKVMRLAMGYEGGVSAFVTMAETYQVDLEDLARTVLPLLPEDALSHAEWMREHHPCPDVKKGEISEDVETACNGLKFLYRQSHPHIKQGWKDMKEAAEKAVEFEGQTFWLPNKRVAFRVQTYKGRKWLAMRLPSGREIRYYKPKWTPPRQSERWINNVLEEYTIPGFFTYWGTDTYTRQWCELQTYGGKLDENADQGFSCDLLCNAMINLDELGYSIVGSEHDKAILEVPETSGSVEEIKKAMLAQPAYTAGLPLATDGKRVKRYGK